MKISIAILAAAAIVEASPQRRRIQNIHNSAVVNAEEEYDVYLGLSKDKKNSVFGRELQDEEGEETGESEMPTCKYKKSFISLLFHCNDAICVRQLICTYIIYSPLSLYYIDSPTKGDSSTPTYSPTCEGDCAPAPVPAEEETTTTEPPVPAEEETTTTEPPVATTEEETITTTEPPVAPIPDIEEEDVVVVDESEMSMPATEEIDSSGLDFAGATEAENTATLYGSSIVVIAAGIATSWMM